jgi:uncharacterized protein (TIGR00255 family)
MTGFGSAEFEIPAGAVHIEIKSTNHRYFEFSSRLPHALLFHEEDIRRITQKAVTRGKVHVTIAAPDQLVRRGRLMVDEELAKEYHKVFTRLNHALGLEEKITLRDIARMPDVITSTAKSQDRHRAWNDLALALKKSIERLNASREAEGRRLAKDLIARLRMIELAVKRIKQRSGEATELFRQRAQKKWSVEKSVEGTRDRQDRLQQDVASYAKNTDVTEELVRLASHITAFRQTLKDGGEVGRKIDFIAQEMVREANTTGSKCNDSSIAAAVIEIKTELEKIREQSQNLE